MGGIIAKNMGLPVKRFVISTNANDEVPVYFDKGNYKTIVPSRNCISSAMNVGHPSNMARIIDLYGGVMDERGNIHKAPDVQRLKADMYAVSISDEQTKATIKDVYERHKTLIEPHGAVGWAGLHQFFKEQPANNTPEQLTVSLETAHPAKFPGEINEILHIDPVLPPSLHNLDDKEEMKVDMQHNYEVFKAYLIKNYK
jgi:threonine synthase